MSNDINLVSSKSHQFQKELKRLKILKITAVGFLALIVLTSLTLFLLTITLPTSSIKKEQEQTLSNISTLHEKLVKYTLINDRVNNIASIVKSRKNYAKTANVILSKLPTDLIVESINIEEGALSLVISGPSLTAINTYLDDVIELGDKEDTIKNLVIQGLTANASSGKYTLTIEADIL